MTITLRVLLSVGVFVLALCEIAIIDPMSLYNGDIWRAAAAVGTGLLGGNLISPFLIRALPIPGKTDAG